MDIFYFLITTLTTVGYGDIVFADTTNRIITIVYIICCLLYVPLAVFAIIRVVNNKQPSIILKQHCSGGIVVIGKFDKQLALLAREVIPSDYDLNYLVTSIEDTAEMENVHKNVSSYMQRAIGPLDRSIAIKYSLERSALILCVSNSSDEDRETVLNAEIIDQYTDSTMQMIVVLFGTEQEKLAKMAFQNSNKVLVTSL